MIKNKEQLISELSEREKRLYDSQVNPQIRYIFLHCGIAPQRSAFIKGLLSSDAHPKNPYDKHNFGFRKLFNQGVKLRDCYKVPFTEQIINFE